MSSLTIDPSYTGGLGRAISDAVAGGHDRLLLQPGVYASDTATSGAHGPGGAVGRLTITPVGGRESIAIDSQILDGANYIRWLNCRFATGLHDAPSVRTLPIFDTAAPCLNAGIKLTPVVTDLPIPRVRARNPKTNSAVENLVVSVVGRDITVTGLGTSAAGLVTTTALSIINAINATPEAAALVTASVKDGQDGSGNVQGGFPFWLVSGVGWRECDLQPFTHHVDFVGCKLATVRLREGCHHVKVKNCEFPQSSFPLTCSINEGDKTISDIYFCGNLCYSGYNTDCAGPRPAHVDNFVMDDNVFEDNVDPEASSIHMDTFQPIFGARRIIIRRNKFIDQGGQCFFMTNYRFHHLLLENNLIHQDGEANLTNQLGGVKVGIIRFNTFIVNGWLWDDGNTTPDEIPDSLLVYNNITNRFSRTTGVPVGQDYNIVQTAGTGWVPGPNETSTLPVFASAGYPNWDYHYLDNAQPGVGDGTPVFRNHGSPATDLDGKPRNPSVVDQGCYVA